MLLSPPCRLAGMSLLIISAVLASVSRAEVAAPSSGELTQPAVAGMPANASDETPATGPAFEIVTLRDGLQVLLGGGGNTAVWSGADGVVLVDDKLGSVTAELLETVNRIAPGGIRFVINTHWHSDHTGANEPIGRSGGVIIAHENVRARMSSDQFIAVMQRQVPASDPAALPIVTFADAVTMYLNGDRLDVIHLADAHTDGDAVLWWRDANVVHVGDIFRNGSYPYIDTSSGGSLAGLVAALEVVLARADERTVIIPGHGPIATRADLAAYRDMVVEIGRKVREMIEQGRSLEEIVAAGPAADYDEQYAGSFMPAEMFIGILYEDLTSRPPGP
jgi:cyclase